MIDRAGIVGEIIHTVENSVPTGWRMVEASFAVTVVAESVVLLVDAGSGPARYPVSRQVWDPVHRHRELSARSDDGPWWRLIVRLDSDGHTTIDEDRGTAMFPREQLFAPEAYLADLDVYPRDRMPIWLAAYTGRGARTSRSPRRAAAREESDLQAGIRAQPVTHELPDLAALWARWAVLSAAFVAAESGWGPRISTSTGVFEGQDHCGSTLVLLPRGRAVLSGGVWNAPALDATCNSGTDIPDFYAGAPAWVSDPVLDARAATGLLSFCFWWDRGQWYRGASPSVAECALAIPAIWTANTVTDLVGTMLGATDADASEAIESLVHAAETGVVTHDSVRRACGHDDRFDIAAAVTQLGLAGVMVVDARPIGEREAIELVREHILRRGYDTTGYPLSELSADRFGVGWTVSVPTPPDAVVLNRAVFHVTDDGVVEMSTASVPNADPVADIVRRYSLRREFRT